MKGGEKMGYSVKWVVDNLGITRDMLRYYEKEKLLPIDETRNPANKYRDYSEEDIQRIWTIKLFMGIGFTAKELRAWVENPDISFYEAISNKVEQLEQKKNEILTYLQFAQTIKMTGRIPNTAQIGIMKFDDFIEYARQNWNAFTNPTSSSFMESADTLLTKKPEEMSVDTIEHLLSSIFGTLNPEQMSMIQTVGGYYRVLADMKDLGYSHQTVQSVVKLLYEYMHNNVTDPQYRDQDTPLCFADHTISSFRDSGIAELNARVYGEEECLFIAQAIAYFGGYNLND